MKQLLLFICMYCFPLISWGQYISGTSYFDTNNYIEYIAGDLPIIITAPHGGYLEPNDSIIPDRNCSGCSYQRDSYTQELSRALKDALYAKTGCYPHVILNLLHRKKLDANRAIIEAADSNLIAEAAWYAFHEFIDTARTQLIANYNQGLYLDMHGHAHTIQRLELGYRLSKSDLQQPDSHIDMETSSIQNLVTNNLNNYTHSELIRGQESFGALCENKGYPSVPSFNTPSPLGSEPYFQGGYNTIRYGSETNGTIDAIQIECNSAVRFNAADRTAFADSLATVVLAYLDTHYFANLSPNYCLPTPIPLITKTVTKSYPNPAKDEIYIYANSYPLDVDVYRTTGELVQQIEIYSSRDKINLSGLDGGLYFLQLKREGIIIQTQKILKINP